MIKEIENWLSEPVYWTGVELYEKYGENDRLKKMFSTSADSYNKKKIAQLLTEILEATRLIEQQKPKNQLPPEVQLLQNAANSLMDERSALKERARMLVAQGIKEGPELAEIANNLAFGIKNQLDSIYARIQYAQMNGSLPETDAAAAMSIAEMIKRRNTLRTYLSRGTDPAKIEKWKAEAFQLDLKIKELES
jgi:hypothetical protein